MNFLAHIYLSNNHPEIQIGNFIADAIRGNQFNHFPQNIQLGIHMHRHIDSYTDTHYIFKQSKQRLDLKYNLYRGVIIDIIYDHFLAKNWHLYNNTPLQDYTQNIYRLLQANLSILPEKTQYLLPYMIEQNWLYNYRTVEGIGNILYNMNRRTKGISKMDEAIYDLEKEYTYFESDFTHFFKEMIEFSNGFLNQKGFKTF